MASIGSAFRKYHRQLSIIFSLPLIFITLTGIVEPILKELHFKEAAEFMLEIHSGEILGTEIIYSVLCGLGLLGLLVTGLSMTGLFGGRRPN